MTPEPWTHRWADVWKGHTRAQRWHFPNLDQVIPRSYEKKLTMPAEGLAAAVRRVVVMTEEQTHPVVIESVEGQLRVSARGVETGESELELGIAWPYEEPLKIGLNSRYLLQYLGSVEGGSVTMGFKDGVSPMLLGGDGQPVSVIMPMRV